MVEFASGMDFGQDYFERGDAAVFVQVDRDPPSIIGNRDRTVGVQRHMDIPAVAGHCLVDRIINDFVHKVVEAPRRRVADIHRGP